MAEDGIQNYGRDLVNQLIEKGRRDAEPYEEPREIGAQSTIELRGDD